MNFDIRLCATSPSPFQSQIWALNMVVGFLIHSYFFIDFCVFIYCFFDLLHAVVPVKGDLDVHHRFGDVFNLINLEFDLWHTFMEGGLMQNSWPSKELLLMVSFHCSSGDSFRHV